MTRTSAPFPTKIGLGFYLSPARLRACERRQTSALRGRAGQGLHRGRAPCCTAPERRSAPGLLSLHRTNFRMVRATNGAARSWRVAQAYNALRVAAVTRSTGSHVVSNPRRARRDWARIAANSTADRKLDGARG